MTALAPQRARLRASHVDRGAQRRELYFFTLYRAFQAAILAFFVFSPVGMEVAELRVPWLGRVISTLYLMLAIALLLSAYKTFASVPRQAAIGLTADILVMLLARHALQGPDTALALLLIVNIGAGALLLPFRWGIGFAAVAGAGTVVEFVLSGWGSMTDSSSAAETAMFVVTYLTAAVLCHSLGKQLRESLELAERRGEQAANLAQINELIIRRMQTGVLVVDAKGQIRLLNESAWSQLGEPPTSQRSLAAISPALADRLQQWRANAELEPSPLSLRSELPDVIPRMTGLGTTDDLFLVFLDDGVLVSRRAEQLTLSALGRLSASIAHEIRNPLSAINHAAQLLDESPALPADDRRLIEIVLTHCQRMNGIVGSVLALSRRERSRPETLDLGAWTRRFADAYRAEHFLDADTLRLGVVAEALPAVFDPEQLHQVISALISNALQHGRLPDARAVVTLRVGPADDSGFPTLDVMDRGPGIPSEVGDKVFEPFFTTSDVGSGLGLYIARQVCEANQASLEYLRLAHGGSCFRLTLARPVSADSKASVWNEGSSGFAGSH